MASPVNAASMGRFSAKGKFPLPADPEDSPRKKVDKLQSLESPRLTGNILLDDRAGTLQHAVIKRWIDQYKEDTFACASPALYCHTKMSELSHLIGPQQDDDALRIAVSVHLLHQLSQHPQYKLALGSVCDTIFRYVFETSVSNMSVDEIHERILYMGDRDESFDVDFELPLGNRKASVHFDGDEPPGRRDRTRSMSFKSRPSFRSSGRSNARPSIRSSVSVAIGTEKRLQLLRKWQRLQDSFASAAYFKSWLNYTRVQKKKIKLMKARHHAFIVTPAKMLVEWRRTAKDVRTGRLAQHLQQAQRQIAELEASTQTLKRNLKATEETSQSHIHSLTVEISRMADHMGKPDDRQLELERQCNVRWMRQVVNSFQEQLETKREQLLNLVQSHTHMPKLVCVAIESLAKEFDFEFEVMTMDNLSSIAVEDLMLNWVNYVALQRAHGRDRLAVQPVNNFSRDFCSGLAWQGILWTLFGDKVHNRQSTQMFANEAERVNFVLRRMTEVQMNRDKLLSADDIAQARGSINFCMLARLMRSTNSIELVSDKLCKQVFAKEFDALDVTVARLHKLGRSRKGRADSSAAKYQAEVNSICAMVDTAITSVRAENGMWSQRVNEVSEMAQGVLMSKIRETAFVVMDPLERNLMARMTEPDEAALLTIAPQFEDEEELARLQRVLRNHGPGLLKAFRYYAMLEDRPDDDTALTMSRWEFSRLLQDTHIVGPDLKLTRVKVLFETTSQVLQGHEGELDAQQFCLCLLRIAAVKFSSQTKSAAQQMDLLLEGHIKHHTPNLTPFQKEFITVDVQRVMANNRAIVRKLFDLAVKMTQQHSRDSTGATAKNSTSMHSVLYVLRDAQVMKAPVTPALVMSMVNRVQDDMDGTTEPSHVHIVMEEFEALLAAIACFTHSDPFLPMGRKVTLFMKTVSIKGRRTKSRRGSVVP